MIDYQKVFDKLDQLEERYIKIWEEFCLIESPTDYKEGVDNASDYIVQIAKKFGCRIERQKQNVSGDCICITMNPDLDEAPVCLSGHVDTVHPVGLFGTPAVRYDGDEMYDLNDALYASLVLNIDFSKFSIEEFLDGINIEMEHGKVNEKTNVTNDDLIETAKIALAHLNEYPNYYNKEYGLKTFEEFLKYQLNNN